MKKQLFKLSALTLAGLLTVNANPAKAQNYSTRYDGFAAAVFVTENGNAKTYNVFGNGSSQIAPDGPSFNDGFGTFVQNSASLWLMGSEVKTYKNNGANICGVSFVYNIYPYCNGCATPPSATTADLYFKVDCNNGVFADGYGPCSFGDQKWRKDDNGIDLTNRPPGAYVMDVYYRINGSNYDPSGCDQTIPWGAYEYGGGNYSTGWRSLFYIVAPTGAKSAGKNAAGLTATANSTFTLKVYPNPVTSAVAIDPVNFDEGLVQMAITNIQGSAIKTVNETYIKGQSISLDMSSYGAGMYFVRLQQGSKTATAKVVKQ